MLTASPCRFDLALSVSTTSSSSSASRLVLLCIGAIVAYAAAQARRAKESVCSSLIMAIATGFV
jgi:hypothetical protein